MRECFWLIKSTQNFENSHKQIFIEWIIKNKKNKNKIFIIIYTESNNIHFIQKELILESFINLNVPMVKCQSPVIWNSRAKIKLRL